MCGGFAVGVVSSQVVIIKQSVGDVPRPSDGLQGSGGRWLRRPGIGQNRVHFLQRGAAEMNLRGAR